jgi:cobalt-zinc-cadmium resistance protein CzcA
MKTGLNPAAAVVFLLFLSLGTSAQKIISLDEMLKMAGEKNLSLQTARKETEYWKQLQSGVFDPAKTQVGAEYGNINSFNNDIRFFVNQSFGLPVVYKRQQELYKAHANAQQQMANWKQAELHMEVKETFYQLAELMERKKLLLRLDSVYGRFQQSAELRLKAGRS